MKLLFITATRIGDAVLSTGLLGWLIDRHPGARVTVVCGQLAAPLFAAMPGLERVIAIDKRPMRAHWLGLWIRCAPTLWDMVVDLRGSAIAYVLAARARRVVGKRDESVHRVRETAALFDLDPPPAPCAWVSGEDIARGEARVPPGRPFLALGPSANWRGKTWRAERFAELTQRLVGATGALAGARVVVFGAASEHADGQALIGRLPGLEVIDLIGRVELPVVAAIVRRAALYVGNDSGLMHLAAASGAPTLGLFGPSDERRYAPWGRRAACVRTPQSPRELIDFPGYDHRSVGTLMDTLTVDAVLEAANALLRDSRGRAA